MTDAVIFTNNATSRLGIDVPAASITITLEAGTGARFPTPAAAQFFPVVVSDQRTGQYEIMYCTQRVNDILTVTRAQEGTSAQDFLLGASVWSTATAAVFQTYFGYSWSKDEADTRFVNTTGDTMTGALTLPGNPTIAKHATTKEWVEALIAGAVGLTEAPIDGNIYARFNASWVQTVTKSAYDANNVAITNAFAADDADILALQVAMALRLTDAPNDANIYARSGGAWAMTVTKTAYDANNVAITGFLAGKQPLNSKLTTLSAALTGKARFFARVKSDESDYEMRSGPWYNVYDYGAVGDGVADDTAALVACIAAADANTGIQASAKGRGVTVVPPGFFAISGITLTNVGSKILGLGGRIQALSNNVTPITVSAGGVILQDLTLYNPFRPTIASGVLAHTTGSDCRFRNITLIGGYHGFKGTGGGDSSFYDMKINSCYADYVFLQNYSGMWCNRGKFDGAWPVATPVAANVRGNWANGMVVVANDVVNANGWHFQCRVGGTTAAAGGGPTVADFGVDINDNGVQWRTAFTQNRAAMRIDSGCFANNFVTSDFTGGHDVSVNITNSLATTAPQSVYFSGLCEFGSPQSIGLWIQDGDNIDVTQTTIDNGISATAIGVACNGARDLRVHDCTIFHFEHGFRVPNTSENVNIYNNLIQNCADGVRVNSGATSFVVSGNIFGGGTWGDNSSFDINILAGASDNYIVGPNRCRSTNKLNDGGTGVNKFVQGNL